MSTKTVKIDAGWRQFETPISLLGQEVHGEIHFCEFDTDEQVIWEGLISRGLPVQDFFSLRQCLPVIVSSLLGIQRNWVTSLDPVGTNILARSRQFIARTESAIPIAQSLLQSGTIAKVDERRFQRLEVSDRRYPDVTSRFLQAPGKQSIPKASSNPSMASSAQATFSAKLWRSPAAKHSSYSH